ncbi:STAS domain-containing protein [Streptomyces sp. A7024]|uniref:STAS domain-containing protein n=1 Tax=Streptomyces coryli TaxID=1128680 RepID=A0A6G4TRJ6_9ACTN|nr:STAS domain-containing protein [Streptomyces coryli]NGN62615.1 STAS domain-containing protein [Streptomyces coryli]
MTVQRRHLSVSGLASSDGCAVLRVSGQLDHHSERDFLVTMGSAVAEGRRYVVLDVTALAFCDSRGLNCLLGLHWILDRRGGTLLLAGAGSRLSQLLELTGSAALLPAHTAVKEALQNVPEDDRPAWPPAPQQER